MTNEKFNVNRIYYEFRKTARNRNNKFAITSSGTINIYGIIKLNPFS